MLKKLLFVLSVSLVLLSCGKDSGSSSCVVSTTGVALPAEVTALQAYLTSKSIVATQDPSGFFYIITNQGSGSTANANSVITVRYTGTLEDGTVFDSNTSQLGYLTALSGTIVGWQKAIPLIQKGGSITLYVPPSLAYGCTVTGTIPAGSALIFTIELINIQ